MNTKNGKNNLIKFSKINFLCVKAGSFFSALLILPIRFYQICISPLFPPTCRFYPTCSAYAVQALKKYGPVKGLFLTVKRILKCHPFHPGGYDPLK